MSNIKIRLTDNPQLSARELEYNTFYYCVNDGQTYMLINTNTNTCNNIQDRAVVPISNTGRDAGEFCIRLDNDELLFINDRGFILVPNAYATNYIMENKTATKLHNVKITISYDC